MPALSGAQYRFMQMSKHNPEKMRGDAAPADVATEFIEATPPEKRKRWAKKPKREKSGQQRMLARKAAA